MVGLRVTGEIVTEERRFESQSFLNATLWNDAAYGISLV